MAGLGGKFLLLILATSYLVTNLYWLRVLAMLALGLEGVYFYFASAPPLWVGIGWAAVFVAINLVQLVIMTRERFAVRMSEQEALLHRGLFARLTPVQFHRLLKIGTWREIEDGMPLTIQDRPVPELLFIARGTAKVMVGTDVIALVQMGSFIGEMSFMTGGNACATVVGVGRVRIFAITKSALDTLLHRDHQIETAILRVIGQDLTLKLRTQTLAD